MHFKLRRDLCRVSTARKLPLQGKASVGEASTTRKVQTRFDMVFRHLFRFMVGTLKLDFMFANTNDLIATSDIKYNLLVLILYEIRNVP